MQIIAHVTWMRQKDFAEVLEMERECFEFPWDEKAFRESLRTHNNIGMVVEFNEHPIGYMVYQLHKNRLHLLNLAVSPYFRRSNVGSLMINKLVGKLSYQRRRQITLEVRESNVDAQLFFKSHGFRAVEILRGWYDDTDEDAYRMVYLHGGPVDVEQSCSESVKVCR